MRPASQQRRPPAVANENTAAPGWGARPARPKPGEALGEYAHRVLRAAIRSGRFKPGMHLPETEVSRWLDISRTPVREAIHRLVAEGLLATGPWNGVMIAELDRQQLVELYAVREALEGTAAALAAQHASKAEVQLIQAIAAREGDHEDDPAALVAINGELHRAIYEAAHNRYLLQSINTIVDALGLLRHSTFVLPGSSAQARREHLEIIRAIRGGNAQRAEQMARRHVRGALELRLRLHAETEREH